MKLTQTTTLRQKQKGTQKQRPSQQQLLRQKMLSCLAQNMNHEIENALEANSLLEVTDPAEGDVDYAEPEEPINDVDGDDSDDAGNEDDAERESLGDDANDDEEDDASGDGNEIFPTDIFANLNFGDDDEEDELPPSLLILDDFQTQYDEWKSEILGTPHLDDEERSAATAIVDDLLPNGMLKTHLADIAMACQVDMPVVERALAFIQSLSPAGIGARDVVEYFSLQLDRVFAPNVDKARTILSAWRVASEEFASELKPADNGTESSGKSGKKSQSAGMNSVLDKAITMSPAVVGRLREISGLSDEDFHDGARLLARLRRPGSAELSVSDQLVPEVEIVPDNNGKFVADYIPGPWSRLKVNDSFLGDASGSTANYFAEKLTTPKSREIQRYFKKKLKNAIEFKDSIQFRMDTVTALAQMIADAQGEFLKTGDKSKIVPISMKDAAAKLGLDASTISRAANDKLVKTPVGIMFMKKLFELSTPSRLAADSGKEPVTNDAVMEIVREVIESEPDGKPYSDQKITEILKGRGINIARRTVEKYRKNLGIGNAFQRRKA